MNITLNRQFGFRPISRAELEKLLGNSVTAWTFPNYVDYDYVSNNSGSLASTGLTTGYSIQLVDSGTRMYAHQWGTDSYQFNLTIPYDASTAAYVNKFNMGYANARGVFVSPDGTRAYVLDSNNDRIREFSLGTAWDITSATDTTNSIYYGAEIGTSYCSTMSYDGYHAYVHDVSTGVIYQYDMTTAWDVSTASYNSKLFDTGVASLAGFTMNEDGTEFLTLYISTLRRYTMSTPFDISTAVISSPNKTLSKSTGGGNCLTAGGDYMYVFNYSTDDTIYRIENTA